MVHARKFKCGCHSVILRLSKDLDTGTPNCKPVLLIFPLIGKFHSSFFNEYFIPGLSIQICGSIQFCKTNRFAHWNFSNALCFVSFINSKWISISCVLFVLLLATLWKSLPFLLIAFTFCLISVLFQSHEPQYRVSKSPKSIMQKSCKQARTKNFKARSYHDMSDMIKVNKYNVFVDELEYVEHNRP